MRRKIVSVIAAVGMVFVMLITMAPAAAQIPGGTLDPNDIPKYMEPLVIPPVQPSAGHGAKFTLYRIAAKQFQQQVLPQGFPKTTVWGYGNANGPGPGKPGSTYNWPAFTIETRTNETVRVYWKNDLVDKNRSFLPHLLPVDPTLHWANPPGPRDMRPMFDETPQPYTGPVPIVTHVHGAHVPAASDGHPEAWYLPNAKNIPAGYFTKGTHYNSVLPAPPGQALFEYPNDQRATTLWYHDHALGITRLNVYAGLAGFWLIRDEVEDSLNLPGPAPRLGDKPGTRYYEIPMAIQDRSFNQDGSLFYPDTRAFFDEYTGPYVPETPVSPIWNPEFFGNTMTVNGRTWPYLEIEPRLYRFRMLNGSNSRFLILKFDQEGLTFHQIGSEGGLLPGAPVEQEQLLVAPAERPDVIVDFSSFEPGDVITLLNLGPDEPFKGFNPDGTLSDGEGGTLDPADPDTTGQVMQFRVVPLTGNGNAGEIPAVLPPTDPLETTLPMRDLTLNEEMYEPADIPIAALLGTAEDGPLSWMDAITENPGLNDTEIWRLNNFTADAHPIHLHLVMFQVIGRAPLEDPENIRPPEEWETGWKDTVIAYPDEITYIIAKFDLPGLYERHCHILEHEDNEMMRPYYVGPMP